MSNKIHNAGITGVSSITGVGITGVGSTGFIDYLSFTLPSEVDVVEAVEKLLGIPFAKLAKAKSGRNGYRGRYEFGNITLLTDGGTDDMGHNITLTGTACQKHQGRLREIATLVFTLGGHFTRCDLAIDDRRGLLEMVEIQQAIKGGLVQASFATVKEYNAYDRKTGRLTGTGAYFGSRKSEVFIRIYDKALEQAVDYHWIRVEVELKGSKADAALKLVLQQDIGEITRGILKDRLSFREPGTGMNRSRWPISPWWVLFLGCVEKLKLVMEASEPATQEARLLWFVSNAATFAELYDVCGPGIIPFMYVEGKQRLAARKESGQ